MDPFWKLLEKWVPLIADDYVWGWGPGFLLDVPLMVIFLLGTGVILSLLTRFVQIRRFKIASQLVIAGAFKKTSTEGEGDITPFQALMTALSATVGNRKHWWRCYCYRHRGTRGSFRDVGDRSFWHGYQIRGSCPGRQVSQDSQGR